MSRSVFNGAGRYAKLREKKVFPFFDGIILPLCGIIPSNTVAFEFPSARQVVITTTKMQEAFLMEQGVMQSFGERWFSRFLGTDSFRPSTKSYRQLLPPLNSIRPPSGLHDVKYPRSVFNRAQRVAKLRGSMVSRFCPNCTSNCPQVKPQRSLPCTVFWVVVCAPRQAPSHNKRFTNSICRTRKNCGDVQ